MKGGEFAAATKIPIWLLFSLLGKMIPPGFFAMDVVHRLYCVVNDGDCGATSPLYRHYRLTTNGICKSKIRQTCNKQNVAINMAKIMFDPMDIRFAEKTPIIKMLIDAQFTCI